MDLVIFTLFNFIIYSFIGWIVENIYSFATKGEFQKDGFLFGPFKPMYGIAGAIIILLNTAFNLNLIEKIIIGFIIPTITEYCTGYILKVVFSKSYWDYSNLKYQIQGLVSLQFSLYWILLTFVAIYIVQPVINIIYQIEPALWSILTPFFIGIMTLDMIYTIITMNKKASLLKNANQD